MTFVPSSRLDLGRRLRVLYAGKLIVFGSLLLTGNALIQWTLDQQQADARLINLAGRQRMLSQQLVKAAQGVVFLESRTDRESSLLELRRSLDLWTSTHEGLRHGDASQGLPGDNSPLIQSRYDAMQPVFERMVVGAQQALEGKPEGLEALRFYEQDYLAKMNAIVFAYDEEAQAKVGDLQRMQWVCVTVLALLLGLSAIFIYEPTVRALQREDRSALDDRLGHLATLEQDVANLRRRNTHLVAQLDAVRAEMEAVEIWAREHGA